MEFRVWGLGLGFVRGYNPGLGFEGDSSGL